MDDNHIARGHYCQWALLDVRAAVAPTSDKGHRLSVTTLAERLRSAREGREWGVNELDRRAGVSVGTTTRIENGTRASKTGGYGTTIAKLATALGVRSEWLGKGEGPMIAPPDAPPSQPTLR